MLLLLVLTAVTLITVDSRDGGTGIIGSVRNGAHDAAAPAQEAVDRMVRPVSDWWSGVTDAGDLRRENRTLRRELADAQGQVSQSRAAVRENRRLRTLAALPFIGATPTITAQVVAASPGNFERTIGLDKGTADGVAVGMPVVTGEGLLGRVSEASRRRSTVRLITDPDAGTGVRLQTSNVLAVARGRAGTDVLHLEFVPSDATVQRGELVVTSGLDNAIYPPNLPVAKVTSARRDPRSLEQAIEARPLADLDRLDFVRVLRWTPPAPAPTGAGG